MSVNYKPDGFNNVIPYILIEDIPAMLQFTKSSFDAVVTEEVPDQTGQIDHAEIKIGDSMMMIGKASDKRPPMPATFYIYVQDCNDVYNKCLDAEAESLMPPEDMFYGDTNAGVQDPQGNIWWIATHFENVSQEELIKRVASQRPRKE